MIKRFTTRVISSLVRFSSALKKAGKAIKADMIEVFFIAGVAAVSVGAGLQWGTPVGLMVVGALLLAPVVNKLR